jgi:hypothetical protein
MAEGRAVSAFDRLLGAVRDVVDEAVDRVRPVEVEGWVWCDKYESVHADTLNPEGYIEDGKQDYCQPIHHRALYVRKESE